MGKLVAIDLFSGAGGLSLGLGQAGFDVRAAVDNDELAVETYRQNLGEHILCASLGRHFDVERLLDIGRLERGQCDLLAGGPPCQGFSVKRRGPDKDSRNDLLLEYFRLLDEIRPTMFLVENVPGLLSNRGMQHLTKFLKRAEKSGYYCQVNKLDAADFGVPQFRIRTFIVGQLISANLPVFEFPSPTHDSTERLTVRDAIGDLPSPPKNGAPHRIVQNHYREAKLAQINIERIKHIPQGGGREHLPPHLELPCHQGRPGLRHVDVYGRLAWDAPSVTLTARFDSFTRGRFAHPTEHRSITIREGARIQTFPDEFVFYGNREQCARQVGNAVPPLMAQLMGQAIRDTLSAKVRRVKQRSIAAQMQLL